jgi:hypothetical protein
MANLKQDVDIIWQVVKMEKTIRAACVENRAEAKMMGWITEALRIWGWIINRAHLLSSVAVIVIVPSLFAHYIVRSVIFEKPKSKR